MTTGTVTADGRARVLADGNEIPLLGLGVWQVPHGPTRRTRCAGRSSSATATSTPRRPMATKRAWAARCATAACRARRSSSPRSSFRAGRIRRPRRSGASNGWASTTWTSTSSTGPRVDRPGPGPGWKRARERGYARSIGVSNFSVSELDELMSVAQTAPVVNQVQFSPFEYRRKLLEACVQRGVALEAYSPLGTGRHLSDERVRQIAERVGRTPAQVLLRWCVQRDLVVIPKSTHRDRIGENAQIFDFALPEEDMAALDALDQTGGTDAALEHPWW